MGVFWSTPPPEPHPSVVFGIDGTREDPKEWTDNKLLIHGTKGSGKSTAVKQPHSRGSSDFLTSDDENLRYDFPETQTRDLGMPPSNTPAFPLLRLPDELLRLIIGILSHGGGGGGDTVDCCGDSGIRKCDCFRTGQHQCPCYTSSPPEEKEEFEMKEGKVAMEGNEGGGSVGDGRGNPSSRGSSNSWFAATARRARDVHITLVTVEFSAWASSLSLMQRRYVASRAQSTAPRVISPEFVQVEDRGEVTCSWNRQTFSLATRTRADSTMAIMRAMAKRKPDVARLMDRFDMLLASEVEESRDYFEDEMGEVENPHTIGTYFMLSQLEKLPSDLHTLVGLMLEMTVVYLALGLLKPRRIYELLAVPNMDKWRWCSIFDFDESKYHANTILVDPLFSFAKWGQEEVNDAYTLRAAMRHNAA